LETIRAAESAGFRLVDIRLTLQCDLRRTDTRSLATGLAVTIRAYVPGDLSALQQLARTAHSNSRFFTDPHFDRERSGELYARWIQQNCENPDGHVVVAQVDNVPIGYVSCTVMAGGETGVIGLVGVDDRYRGRGVAAALLRATLQWLCEQNVQQVRVVTQGCNAAAQRIYQRQGFLTERCELWYHKWCSVDRAP
ncbi:MAG: GNAT family N-acetyltransferase, partial [Verrucomicrobia bacterium]|nr:GNAT family N-acetyltransferase [Verrucomicrobiota bacterium]